MKDDDYMYVSKFCLVIMTLLTKSLLDMPPFKHRTSRGGCACLPASRFTFLCSPYSLSPVLMPLTFAF
ncbi:hypothetical protein AHF37_12416 [Paragonimus kellicotti]|nr:hypothetical protein AHF37_12416 [Paragonimus kellicotti]